MICIESKNSISEPLDFKICWGQVACPNMRLEALAFGARYSIFQASPPHIFMSRRPCGPKWLRRKFCMKLPLAFMRRRETCHEMLILDRRAINLAFGIIDNVFRYIPYIHAITNSKEQNLLISTLLHNLVLRYVTRK